MVCSGFLHMQSWQIQAGLTSRYMVVDIKIPWKLVLNCEYCSLWRNHYIVLTPIRTCKWSRTNSQRCETSESPFLFNVRVPRTCVCTGSWTRSSWKGTHQWMVGSGGDKNWGVGAWEWRDRKKGYSFKPPKSAQSCLCKDVYMYLCLNLSWDVFVYLQHTTPTPKVVLCVPHIHPTCK